MNAPSPPPDLAGIPSCLPACDINASSICQSGRVQACVTVHAAMSPSPDVFPMDGLPISFLRELIDNNGGELAFEGLTTDDVKDKFIAPKTQSSQLSMCAQMKQDGDSRVQLATWFVSHAWRYKFLDLVRALEDFFDRKGKCAVIWLDLLSTSQHATFSRPPEWWQETFCTAIGRMGQVVMVMTPWDNPISLTRAWCLIELFACSSTGSSFNVALPPSERKRFLEQIVERSEAFYGMLGNVDTASSECSRDSDKERIFAAVRTLDGGFTGIDRGVLKTMTEWLEQQLTEQVQQAATEGRDLEECALINALANLLEKKGEYKQALVMYQSSHSRLNIVLGSDHPTTLLTLSSIALLFRCKGEYDCALPLYDECLQKLKIVRGHDHPDTLNTLHQMAFLHTLMGDRTKAESMFEECLVLRKKNLGDMHSDTFQTTNCLALSYQFRGNYSEAETLFVGCLAGRKIIFGISHPETLTSMNNLAMLYQHQGCYDNAEPLFLQCLEGRKRILGEHPDTFSSMSNLASLYRSQKKCDAAEVLFLSTLEARKRLLGEEHPETLSTINNLALLYTDMRRLDAAEKLHTECIQIRKRSLGESHPDTLSSMNNLALLFMSQSRYDIAEAMQKICLDARISSLGKWHPNTLSSMNNLANTYRKLGQHQQAKTLYESCLEGRTVTLGALHLETLSCKINIASLLAESKCYSEAEILFRRTIQDGTGKYGDHHPRLKLWKNSYRDRFNRDFD